jgi:hypothetical protein
MQIDAGVSSHPKTKKKSITQLTTGDLMFQSTGLLSKISPEFT